MAYLIRFMRATDNDTELVPIPMDAETRRRLAAFSRASGLTAVDAAASLLKHLLIDDAFYEAARTENLN